MSKEQDKIFFRNFSLALGVIAVMMVVFFVIAQFAASDDEGEAKMRSAEVAKITEPVGQVTAVGDEVEVVVEAVVAEEAPAGGEASGDVGKTVFDSVCMGCHGIAAMAAMIPQAGDAAAKGNHDNDGYKREYRPKANNLSGRIVRPQPFRRRIRTGQHEQRHQHQ